MCLGVLLPDSCRPAEDGVTWLGGPHGAALVREVAFFLVFSVAMSSWRKRTEPWTPIATPPPVVAATHECVRNSLSADGVMMRKMWQQVAC